MTKLQVIFVIRDFAHDGSIGGGENLLHLLHLLHCICCIAFVAVTRKRLASPGHFDLCDEKYRCQ